MPGMRTHENTLPVLLTPREVASTLRVDLSHYRPGNARRGAVRRCSSHRTHPGSRARAPLCFSKASRRRGDVSDDRVVASRRARGRGGVSSASTSKRGYGWKHQKLRNRWARDVARGEVNCARCGEPIWPEEPWDLGHVDGDKTRHSRPEHRACNRAMATRRAKRRRMRFAKRPGHRSCRARLPPARRGDRPQSSGSSYWSVSSRWPNGVVSELNEWLRYG
jgi:hypothetical protein